VYCTYADVPCPPIQRERVAKGTSQERIAMLTQREWEKKQLACVACGHDTDLTQGTLTYELEDYTVEVEDVPMKVCPQCGERYVSGPVGEIVGDLVAETVESIRRTQENRHTARPSATSIAIRYRDQPFDSVAAIA
jgi:YgiT-type zinc finger domain-containing protein